MTRSDSFTLILARLGAARRRYARNAGLEALAAAVAVVLACLATGGLVEAAAYLSPAVKTACVAGIFTAGFAAGAGVALSRYIRRPDIVEAARLVERRWPDLGDRLVSAVQLGGLEGPALRGQSPSLVAALVDATERETAGYDFRAAVSTRPLIRAVQAAGAAGAAMLLGAVIFPAAYGGALYRLADCRRQYDRPRGVIVSVLVGNARIIRGEDFTTTGMVIGDTGDGASTVYRWEDARDWTVTPLDLGAGNGTFTFRVDKPRRSFEYYAEAGDARTPAYRVEVIERPDITAVEASVTPPRYTGAAPYTERGDGSLRVLAASKITLKITATRMPSSMAIVWGDSTRTKCAVEGDTGAVSFTVDRSIDYEIVMIDTLGIGNRDPIRHRIACLEDEPPRIAILSPRGEVGLPLSMRFPVAWRATDDYGLTAVELRYRLPGEDHDRTVSIARGSLGKTGEGTHPFDLNGLGILPGDTVACVLAAFDNDTIRGPKIGLSDTLVVRVPSVDDLLADTVERQEEGIADLRERAGDASRETGKLDELRNRINSGRRTEWSDRAAVEQSRDALERLDEGLREFSEELERSTARLSEEGMMTLETVEKYRRASELMNELAEGPLKEALRQLSEAAAQVDPAALKAALDKNDITNEQLKKRLDDLVRMLEQVKALQRFELARGLVEDLAAKQADLTQRYRAAGGDPSLAREQERLARDMAALEEELRGMSAELEKQFEVDATPVTAAVDSAGIEEAMQQASSAMSANRRTEADAGQDTANRGLSDLLGRMDRLSASMRQRNTAEIGERVYAAVNAILAVSAQQEDFLAYLDAQPLVEANDPNRGDLARRQFDIMGGLAAADRRVDRIGEVVPEIAGTLDQVAAAVNANLQAGLDLFAAGNSAQAAQYAESGLGNLNRFAAFVGALLEGDESGGGGKGSPGDLMQQLQQLADGQLSLMQQGGGVAQDILARLAAEQRRFAEMLSQLAREVGNDPRLREMLDKLAEDMDETSRMMRRNEDRELVERRQMDIYRRLLDARRSRREKDEPEERKSWTAREDTARGGTLDSGLGERRTDILDRIDRAMQDGFAPEYRDIIRRYFESLLGEPVPVDGAREGSR